MIDRCHAHIENTYLKHCDMSTPILWVSATVARLILAKMWLMGKPYPPFLPDSFPSHSTRHTFLIPVSPN